MVESVPGNWNLVKSLTGPSLLLGSLPPSPPQPPVRAQMAKVKEGWRGEK